MQSPACSELPSPSAPTVVPANMARRVGDLQVNVQQAPTQLKGDVQPRPKTASPLSPVNSLAPSDMRVMAISGDVEPGTETGNGDVAAVQEIAGHMPPRRTSISSPSSFQNRRVSNDVLSPENSRGPLHQPENAREPLQQPRSNSIFVMRKKSVEFASGVYSNLKRAAPIALRAKLESFGDRIADRCVKVRSSNDLLSVSVLLPPQCYASLVSRTPAHACCTMTR